MKTIFEDYFIRFRKFSIKKEKILLVFILFLGILLRVYSIEYGYASNHFSKIDEVDAIEYAMNLYYFSHQKVLFRNPGPWQNLIAFLLIKIFNTVKALNYFMIFVYILSFFLIRKLCFILFGDNKEDNLEKNKNNFSELEKAKIISLISLIFYSFSPWCVKYTNSYWNPYFVIPIITWFFIDFYKWFYKGNEKSIFGIILSLAIMPFFHMIVIYCIGAFLIFVVLRLFKLKYFLESLSSNIKLKFNLYYIILGLLIVFVLYFPMLYFDSKNDFFLIKNYFFFLFKNSEAINYSRILDSIDIGKKGFKYVFHPEVFKIFSNPIIVMTNEISRFTGHTFNEYKYFLNRSFIYFIFGFLFIIPSFIFVLFSYYYFIKDFIKIWKSKNNLKQKDTINSNSINIAINEKDKIDSITVTKFFIGFFILTSGFLFFISGFPHEERFTVIWFPLLIIINSLFLYEIVFEEKIKFNKIKNNLSILLSKNKLLAFNNFTSINKNKNEEENKNSDINLKGKIKFIFIFLFLFNILVGIYINFQHYRTERYPSVNKLVRLIPSPIFYEKVKYAIFNHYFYQIEKTYREENILKSKFFLLPVRSIIPDDYIYYFDKILVKRMWKPFSIYYLLVSERFDKYIKEDKEMKDENITGKIYFLKNYLLNPKIKYFISSEFIFLNWNKTREDIIIDLIGRYININSNLIVKEKEEANYIIYFVNKKYYKDYYKNFENFDKLMEFPDFYLLAYKAK
ncbi:MAG: hypothetical protein N3A58_06145 [Spirochaetes bacterium]|nr:hypothetical protein [Spirochaetota bacterium]